MIVATSFVVTFCGVFVWIFSIPFLLVTAFLWVPIGAGMLALCAGIAMYVQIQYSDRVVVRSIWRDLFSAMPLSTWFESWSTVGATDESPGILCCHPHGILCCGMVVYHFRAKHTVFAVAPILFYIPVFGWIARSLGLIPATERMIKKAIREGHVVILAVGGIEELVAHPDKTLYLEQRFGYLRIAKELGVKLTPCWVEGEFETFYTPRLPLLKMRQRLGKYLGVGIMFPWVFGWNGLWLPRRVPLRLHFGESVTGGRVMVLKDRYLTSLRNVMGTIAPLATVRDLRLIVPAPSPVPRRQNRDQS